MGKRIIVFSINSLTIGFSCSRRFKQVDLRAQNFELVAWLALKKAQNAR